MNGKFYASDGRIRAVPTVRKFLEFVAQTTLCATVFTKYNYSQTAFKLC